MNAERAVELLTQMRENCVPKETDAYNDPLRKEKYDALSMAVSELSIPSGTYAYWTRKSFLSAYPICSGCGHKSLGGFTKFCPNCGARMYWKEKTGD